MALTYSDKPINPAVYRSFNLCRIYFFKSIQICFCAAYCTRRVNVLYKVFRSGITSPPPPPPPPHTHPPYNSISQFSELSGAFIILTVADKAIIFPEQLQNVDTCLCDIVSVWEETQSIVPPVTDGTSRFATKQYLSVTHTGNRCLRVLHLCIIIYSSDSSSVLFCVTSIRVSRF